MEISTNQRKLIFLGLVTILFLILLSALFSIPQKTKKRFEEKVKREYQQTSENIEKLQKEKEEMEKKFQEIISQCEATEDLKVEEIEIEIFGDKKNVKNKKYGYQIEVPKEMLLVKTISPEKIILTKPDEDKNICFPMGVEGDILIEVLDNENKFSLPDFATNYFNDRYGEAVPKDQSSLKEMKINQVNAFRLCVDPTPFVHEAPRCFYFLQKEEKIFMLEVPIWVIFGEEYEVKDEVLDKTVKTFKFL